MPIDERPTDVKVEEGPKISGVQARVLYAY